MNDVYIIESWFGERLNVRQVYAADADDAFRTLEAYLAAAGITECADRSTQAASKLRALLLRR